MDFTLFLTDQQPATGAYFRVHTEGGTFYSPAYPNQPMAIAGIRALVEQLRQLDLSDDRWFVVREPITMLRLFGEQPPEVSGSTAFAERSHAQKVLAELQQAAQVETFDITLLQAVYPNEEETSSSTETPTNSDRQPVDPAEIDDYAGDQPSGSDQPGVQRFAVEVDGKKQYYFHINTAEGKPFLLSESYQSKAGRDNGLTSVLRNLSDREQGKIIEEGKGRFYLQLRARNNREIARSPATTDRQSLEQELKWVRQRIVTWLDQLDQEKGWREIGSQTIEIPRRPADFPDYGGDSPGQSRPLSTLNSNAEEEDPAEVADEAPGTETRGYEPGEAEPQAYPESDRYPEVEPESPDPTRPPATVVDPAPPPLPDPCAPLFRPLNHLERGDEDLFYGRDREVEDLYEMTFDRRLLLIYGPEQVGKTSLVRCGLANRIGNSRWESIYFDKLEGNLAEDFQRGLEPSEIALGIETDPEDNAPLTRLKKIYEWGFRPIFLVFDNVESLFAPDIAHEQRDSFFTLVKKMTQTKEFPCRVVLILNEQSLAALADYEALVPDLLTNRYRVRPLLTAHTVPAVSNALRHLQKQGYLTVAEPHEVAKAISKQLENDAGLVPQQCLQIYLHQLHQCACRESEGTMPHFDPTLVENYPAGSLIGDYLDEYEQYLDDPGTDLSPAAKQREKKQLTATREDCGCDTARIFPWPVPPVPVPPPPTINIITPVPVAILPPDPPPPVPAPFPWLRIISLIGLIGSVIAFYFIYGWAQCYFDPCCQARKADTCTAYVDYVIRQGATAECSTEFLDTLVSRGCATPAEVDTILRLLIIDTCPGYRRYLNYFGPQGIASPTFRVLLAERGCYVRGITDKLPPDTVYIYDTIYPPLPPPRRGPVNPLPYDIKDWPPKKSDAPDTPCLKINDLVARNIWEWYIQAEKTDNPPRNWNDALRFCRNDAPEGFRLPCVGEVRSLIEDWYEPSEGTLEEKSKRAYELLVGDRECHLFKIRSSGTVEYWTATEASDTEAYAFVVNHDNQTVGRSIRRKKETLRNCLCFYRKDEKTPPCYEKTLLNQ